MNKSEGSDMGVSCVLDIYPEEFLQQLEDAVSSGRHFSYAIPYVPGKTFKKELCLIAVVTYETIVGGKSAPLYACIANSGRKVTTTQRYLALTDFVRVEDVSYNQLMEYLPDRFASDLLRDFGIDFRTLPIRTGQHVWHAIKGLSGRRVELEELEARTRRIVLDTAAGRAETLAAEKDATGLCLDIAGFRRSDILKVGCLVRPELGNPFFVDCPSIGCMKTV